MNLSWTLIVIVNAVLIGKDCAKGLPNPTLSTRKCGKVHLTVSSLKDTYLEMNWISKCDKARDIKPDYIGLFDYNPRDRNEESPPKVLINANYYPDGFYRTKIRFGHPWLPGNWEYQPNISLVDTGRKCFPYWIAAFRGSDIIDTNCLSINPTWMNDIRYRHKGIFQMHYDSYQFPYWSENESNVMFGRDQIRDQRIGNLFIPGTHNSGAYAGSYKVFFENYIINQDRSVWTQLVFGIRYIDLRVGYYLDEGFFVNHDLVRIGKLVPILQEIRKFMELAPREVVVLDFHRFPYPSKPDADIHRRLVSVIQRELGHLALPPGGLQAGKGPTMNEIWHQNKTLIICYGQRDIAREYSWLWNPLQQHWGDKANVGDLKGFISSSIKSHNTIFNPMWAIMAELTPKPLDIVFRTNSLRKLADDVNRYLTAWFREDWLKDVNIVATDFFLGNDLINVAIEANKQR